MSERWDRVSQSIDGAIAEETHPCFPRRRTVARLGDNQDLGIFALKRLEDCRITVLATVRLSRGARDGWAIFLSYSGSPSGSG
jgi:hypothetical protein